MSIAHFTVPTDDVLRTQSFFAQTLGWQSIENPNNIATDACWMQIAEGQQLHILKIDGFVTNVFDREYGRHIAVRYPAEGFEALKQRLVANGAELIEPARDTPFARFFFRDPNGICFEVVDANVKPEAGT